MLSKSAPTKAIVNERLFVIVFPPGDAPLGFLAATCLCSFVGSVFVALIMPVNTKVQTVVF